MLTFGKIIDDLPFAAATFKLLAKNTLEPTAGNVILPPFFPARKLIIWPITGEDGNVNVWTWFEVKMTFNVLFNLNVPKLKFPASLWVIKDIPPFKYSVIVAVVVEF